MYPTLVRRPIDMSDIKKIYWGCRPLPLKEWPAGLKDEEQLAIVTDQCSLFVSEAVKLK